MAEVVIDIDGEWRPPFEVPAERAMREGARYVKIPVGDQVARRYDDALEKVEDMAKDLLDVDEVVWVQTLVVCPDEVLSHPYSECKAGSNIHLWELIFSPPECVRES